jgi:hypothetical protein
MSILELTFICVWVYYTNSVVRYCAIHGTLEYRQIPALRNRRVFRRYRRLHVILPIHPSNPVTCGVERRPSPDKHGL